MNRILFGIVMALCLCGISTAQITNIPQPNPYSSAGSDLTTAINILNYDMPYLVGRVIDNTNFPNPTTLSTVNATTSNLTNVTVTSFYWQTNNFPLAPGAINLDWRAGYQFITTNANFTLNGFINPSNSVVNQVWLSVSNSAASSITFTWIGAPVRNYGTNTATSGPISAGKVWKGLFQLDPHGTNFIWPLMQNN